MSQKYKKPLFIIFCTCIMFGGLGLVSIFAFNYGKSSRQIYLQTPIPTIEANSTKTDISNTPTPIPSPQSSGVLAKVTPFPTTKPTNTPIISPNPTLAATPVPTKVVFTINPLVLLNPSETRLLEGSGPLDGYRSSNNGGSTTVEIWVGRNNVAVFRGFISFDLTSLPSNITIEKAILKISQVGKVGNPYLVGGTVVIDHLDYGSSLESSDYNRLAIKTHIGVLSDNDVSGEKKVEVTDSIKNDLYYKRQNSQYRLRFSTETVGGKSSGDIVYFEPQENLYQGSKPPQLEITFKKNK